MKKIVIALLLLWTVTVFYASRFYDSFQQNHIRETVRETLVKNPEIVRDALIALQQKEAKAERNAAKEQITESLPALTKDKDDPIGGNPKGQVTVVEFFDYNCSYCRRAMPIVERLLKEDKRVRYVFKEFPILSKGSRLAAKVALTLWKQHPDKYKDYHWGLMQAKQRVTKRVVKQQIKKLGLDWNKIKSASDQPEINQKIERNIALAQKLGINGTPSFIIGQQFFPGLVPYEDLKRAVDKSCQSLATC